MRDREVGVGGGGAGNGRLVVQWLGRAKSCGIRKLEKGEGGQQLLLLMSGAAEEVVPPNIWSRRCCSSETHTLKSARSFQVNSLLI